MKNQLVTASGFLLAALMLGEPFSAAAAAGQTSQCVAKHNHGREKKLARKGGWAGAGLAASRAAGPAGGAVVGVTKYRKDLKAGGRRRARAMAKIGGPITAGVVAGPAGVAGYEIVDHRHWIKRHIFRRKPPEQQQKALATADPCGSESR